ncbi:hypothetical protein Taro_006441 [Colocasia esculenta]|uniref:Uncharacterized protein n=1 Tax=Colocasia esculenta TaxID=4460 RepID=A0A843TNP6_COLES|nr:hypothetical protein [Colocasia esculenta]
MVVWRHTWPSRHGHDGRGCRVLVAVSGGVATTFLTDVTAVLSVRTVVTGGRFDHLFGVAPGVAVATLRGVVTWSLSCRADPSCLGGRQFKTEVVPHSPPLTLSLLLLPLSSSLAISRRFFVLVVFVLRWCHPVRAGDVLVVLGARRRWSFRREGPNGSALLVEPFRISGSVGGDCENRVLGMARGSGSRGCYTAGPTALQTSTDDSAVGSVHPRECSSS